MRPTWRHQRLLRHSVRRGHDEQAQARGNRQPRGVDGRGQLVAHIGQGRQGRVALRLGAQQGQATT